MKVLDPEFQHKDERRTLTQLFTSDIKQVNHYEANQGSILGDHFHKETVEYFFIVSGVVKYNGEKLLSKNDLIAVYPEENHTLECLTRVELLSFLTKPFTKENPDLWKNEPS